MGRTLFRSILCITGVLTLSFSGCKGKKLEQQEVVIYTSLDKVFSQPILEAFEKETGIMCSVVMEMSHEGFGRAVVIADKIVIVNKFFKDAHRYSFRTYEKLEEEGEKMLKSAIEIYEEYKKKGGLI